MSSLDEFFEIDSTQSISKPIQSISRDTVHKICSGQVVFNLAVAVKELIENSIDAGATIIELKLKDRGLNQFEVIDNGSGVEKINFYGLTAKHHTSKIREFSELGYVSTLGFRGEALSSLCALGLVTITTRHASSSYATKLIFNHNGDITSESICPRDVGTTVVVQNLFSSLPVRRKEFEKNIKKEFNRMCQVIQGYCLVSTGIRIICSNQSGNGQRMPIFSTNGINSVLDNIRSIFGGKQVDELVRIANYFSDKEKQYSIDDFNESDANISLTQADVDNLNLSKFTIDGWISSCNHEYGRSMKDRQFFYVNDRPCELESVSKLINSVYHNYNINHYPFIYLNIKLERSEVDVNLTPDKRQILINNEKILLLALKKSILNTFSDIPSTFKLQNIQKVRAIDMKLKDENKEQNDNNDSDSEIKIKPNTNMFAAKFSEFKMKGKSLGERENITCSLKRKKSKEKISLHVNKLRKIDQIFSQDSDRGSSLEKENLNDSQKTDEELIDKKFNDSSNAILIDEDPKLDQLSDNSIDSAFNSQEQAIIENCVYDSDVEYDSTSYLTPRNIVKIKISIEEIQNLYKTEIENRKIYQNNKKLDCLKFKSEIKPSKNEIAQQELNTAITKENFKKMNIIGQFNLGFIITKLDNDLFIIDQHASDEKYNFETLQQTTKLESIKLVLPQQLELTALNELVLKDSLEVFRFNGFEFEINEDAPPTKKIKLLTKPESQNWQFGKDDINELIFMLQDAPNTMCRPSRIRTMFASRACRKSVMIGQHLDMKLMKRIIDHMSEIEQPWNCPHGRPTMRHLINLSLLKPIE